MLESNNKFRKMLFRYSKHQNSHVGKSVWWLDGSLNRCIRRWLGTCIALNSWINFMSKLQSAEPDNYGVLLVFLTGRPWSWISQLLIPDNLEAVFWFSWAKKGINPTGIKTVISITVLGIYSRLNALFNSNNKLDWKLTKVSFIITIFGLLNFPTNAVINNH